METHAPCPVQFVCYDATDNRWVAYHRYGRITRHKTEAAALAAVAV